MKDWRIGLTACIALLALAIGLGLFTLLKPNDAATPSSTPTAEAAKTTATAIALAPAATIAPGWSVFHGRYFTMQVPPSWEEMSHDSYNILELDHDPPLSPEVESVEWRANGIVNVLAGVRVRYEPYSELSPTANSIPFQAGDLNGAMSTLTYT